MTPLKPALYAIAAVALCLCACENPDEKSIELFFITHMDEEISELRLSDDKGYEARAGWMRAPSNLKGLSFISAPKGSNGKLQWTSADGSTQSKDVDLAKLQIDPPGTLFLVLDHDDVETTFVPWNYMSPTPDELAKHKALVRKFQKLPPLN